MRDYFFSLADLAIGLLKIPERVLLTFQGEKSDFCRFNHARIRQLGQVHHLRLEIRLESKARHASLDLTLSGVFEEDKSRLTASVLKLREIVSALAPDPYFLMNEEVNSSDFCQEARPLLANEAISEILSESHGLDLVGFLANGKIYRGFANSIGQKNWFETDSFNFDWSLYLRDDKAVKSQYAGFNWSSIELSSKMKEARKQLAYLERPVKELKPGKYRVFLAPSAVHEVMSLLSWRGFGLKSQKTKSSPLMKLVEDKARLSSMFNLCEDVKGGVSPNFDSFGFLKPERISLISSGKFEGSLVSPRTSREFGVPTTAASDSENPESMNLGAGRLKKEDILPQLEDGLYVNNLWYMNFSDAPSCRMTGMTRFASFWVERGEIKNPLAVMRFDDSIYRMFGDNLQGLTEDRELILSSSTYDGRSTHSAHLPGALLKELQLTL